MRGFDRWMQSHAINWRKDHVVNREWGEQNKKRRPWILPSDLWEEGLWSGIGKESDNSLSVYLENSGVQKHDGVHNLNSSWVLCANLYFPFRASDAGRKLFASFLKYYVDSEITSLEKIELEYEDKDDTLKPPNLLGEPGGVRGAHQTSPDLGLLVNEGKGLVLVENKLTEKSFYQCPGWEHEAAQTVNRCNYIQRVVEDPATQCYMAGQGMRRGRKYWDHLKDAMDRDSLMRLPHCPAAKKGYQLLRQQALAEGISNLGNYELVVSAVAIDERNEILTNSLRSSHIVELGKDWGKVFSGNGSKARFAVFTHQQWVAWVRKYDNDGQWSDWLDYVRSRYGLGE